jgi:hypothetical protein
MILPLTHNVLVFTRNLGTLCYVSFILTLVYISLYDIGYNWCMHGIVLNIRLYI